MRLWISGIEQHGQRFRFRMGSGRRGDGIFSYATRAEAEHARQEAIAAEDRRQRKAAALTLDLALIEYRDWYEREGPRGKGAKPQSVQREVMRVALLMPAGPLREPTVDQVRLWYRALQTRVSVAEHQAALKACRRFARWLIAERHWKANPFAAVTPVGEARRGEESKAQLSIDQGRMWLAGALALYDLGDAPALAAAVCLVMGVRASEIGTRRCSELDDGGAWLRIPRGKTRRARRGLPVPHPTPERPEMVDLRTPLLRQQASARAWGRAQPVPQLDPPLFPPISVEPTRRATGETISIYTIRRAVHRVCRAIGLPTVTTHALRGCFSSFAVEQGEAIAAVAAALGQQGTQTAERHYVGAESRAIGQQRARLAVLAGGVRSDGEK